MEKESSGPSRATKWLVAVVLLFGALILGGMFEALGLASWIVVVLAAAVVAYSFYRPEWSILGFSPSGVRKVFGVIGVLLLFGIAAGDTEEKRANEARDIVALMKSRPKEGRKRLAEADDDLLHAIKLVDEGVEAAERSRRVKRDALSARAREARNAAKIASLEKQAQALPSYDLDGRMAIYRQIIGMAPSEAKWRDRMAGLEAEDAKMRKDVEEVRRQLLFPEEFALFELKHWRKGGFGSVMTVSGTIRNNSRFALKDFTLQCELSAPSGTLVDRNVKVVYEQVAAGSSKVIRDFNMGFITEQSAAASCKIVRAVRA